MIAPGGDVARVEGSARPDGGAARRVIVASCVGTVFEWYDFYLYAILAPFFADLFFPPGNELAALLAALGAYAAGFLVRPLGALVFGRIGDRVGRKYAFLVTIVMMGLSTVLLGVTPTYDTIGFAAPVILVLLRLAQGLALGGEYGGAATYVAEHAPDLRRGFATSWIQTTATVGMLLALLVVGLTRLWTSADAFAAWGWRVAFWLSIPLLLLSIYIRIRLQESPVFERLKAMGRRSRAPITDSFLRYPNVKYVALALLGATAGQGVVWYTGHIYALFFLQLHLKLDFLATYALVGVALAVGAPFFPFFGWLSDRIGRKTVILPGLLLAAILYFPLFGALTHAVNPALEAYQARTPITVAASDCSFHLLGGPWSRQTACDRVKDFLGGAGLSFASTPSIPGGPPVLTRVGDTELHGWDEEAFRAALVATGYPPAADRAEVSWVTAALILVALVILVAMVYGPIAALLVELFPAPIRYTSVSLPYHIGNGWFGGALPLLATAMVARAGDVYQGLWYPVAIALGTFVIGALLLPETRHVRIHEELPGPGSRARLAPPHPAKP